MNSTLLSWIVSMRLQGYFLKKEAIEVYIQAEVNRDMNLYLYETTMGSKEKECIVPFFHSYQPLPV